MRNTRSLVLGLVLVSLAGVSWGSTCPLDRQSEESTCAAAITAKLATSKATLKSLNEELSKIRISLEVEPKLEKWKLNNPNPVDWLKAPKYEPPPVIQSDPSTPAGREQYLDWKRYGEAHEKRKQAYSLAVSEFKTTKGYLDWKSRHDAKAVEEYKNAGVLVETYEELVEWLDPPELEELLMPRAIRNNCWGGSSCTFPSYIEAERSKALVGIPYLLVIENALTESIMWQRNEVERLQSSEEDSCVCSEEKTQSVVEIANSPTESSPLYDLAIAAVIDGGSRKKQAWVRGALQAKADNGDPEAMFWYGVSLVPEGAKKIPKTACTWIRNSLYEGFENAMPYVLNCVPDEGQMRELLLLSQDDYALRRYYILSKWRYDIGSISAKDDDVLFAPLKALADSGDQIAQQRLFMSYDKGWGRRKDLVEAAYWYLRMITHPAPELWSAGRTSTTHAESFRIGDLTEQDLLKVERRLKASKKSAAHDLQAALDLVGDQIEEKSFLREQKLKLRRREELSSNIELFDNYARAGQMDEANEVLQKLNKSTHHIPSVEALKVAEILSDRELPEVFNAQLALTWFLKVDSESTQMLFKRRGFNRFAVAHTLEEHLATLPYLIASATNDSHTAARLAARVLVASNSKDDLELAYFLAKGGDGLDRDMEVFDFVASLERQRQYQTKRQLLDAIEAKLSSSEIKAIDQTYRDCFGLPQKGNHAPKGVRKFKQCLLQQLQKKPLRLAKQDFEQSSRIKPNGLYLTNTRRPAVMSTAGEKHTAQAKDVAFKLTLPMAPTEKQTVTPKQLKTLIGTNNLLLDAN